jgi:GTP cyclohydrolase I
MEQDNRSLKLYKVTWNEVMSRVDRIVSKFDEDTLVYGIPRGGMIVAGLTGRVTDNVHEANIIIDDLYDSGTTYKRWHERYPDKKFIFLFDKRKEHQNTWLEFPWEYTGEKEVEENVIRILEYLGEDATREGLKDTPKRYIKFWKEFLSPPDWKPTTFSAEGYDQMIIQTNIPFYSVCEHHLAPFFGTGAIAYIPNKKIIGLSKLARTLETFSRRLQNQERITNQVVDYLMEVLEPKGVGCIIKAKHLCMEMRGVKKHNTHTTTSALRGVFEKEKVKNEFLKLIEL